MKLTHANPAIRPVDLLVCSGQFTTIEEYMKKYFPFSIQCIARDVLNWERVEDHSMSGCSFILVGDRSDDTYLEKYKQYYPDKLFLKKV